MAGPGGDRHPGRRLQPHQPHDPTVSPGTGTLTKGDMPAIFRKEKFDLKDCALPLAKAAGRFEQKLTEEPPG